MKVLHCKKFSKKLICFKTSELSLENQTDVALIAESALSGAELLHVDPPSE